MSAARSQMMSGSRSDKSQGLLGQTAADSCARSCSADDHAAGESTLMLLLSRSWPWNFKGQYRGCRLEDLQDFCNGFDLVMKVFSCSAELLTAQLLMACGRGIDAETRI